MNQNVWYIASQEDLQMKNKKAELAWEQIAIIIIGLVVVLAIIIFSTQLKEKIIEGISYFSETILGR